MVIALVYYPILSEFVAIVAKVHVALPTRIRVEQRLDFEAVSGDGGLRPVGTLIERSGRRYVMGLIRYTLLTMVSDVQGNPLSVNVKLIAVDTAYLITGTLAGALLFL